MTPGRADARRNREVVLRTAARLLEEEGLEVSLGRIAQRAGVGAGTVYRHFPSKERLVEAVLVEHVDGLVTAADRWASTTTPGEALFGFLRHVIENSVGRQHICEALTADRTWPHATLAAAAGRFADALDRLLRKAKQAAVVHPDVRTADLTALAIGCAATLAAHPNRTRGNRMVHLMLDGLRTAAVTEHAELRDVSTGRRHETHCAECGTRLTVGPTGRPPRYCGQTCRQRARRRRLAG